MKKIVWAVDAFQENAKDQLRVGKTLPHLLKGRPMTVTPIAVLSRGVYDSKNQVFLEKWSDLARAGKRNLEALFKRFSLPGLQQPRVIPQKGRATRFAVEALIAFAKEERADMIAVSSHARSGAKRILLGSFAETLVLRSSIPVLVINPKSEATQKIKHILFPTDFSKKSERAYAEILGLAARLNCKVHVIHKLEFMRGELGYPFLVPPVSADSVKELSRKALHQGKTWEAKGRAVGVNVSFYLANHREHALEEILKMATRFGSSSIIAMASQSGAVRAVMAGSLTRQVLRHVAIPVLVMHPDMKARARDRAVETVYKYTLRPLIAAGG